MNLTRMMVTIAATLTLVSCSPASEAPETAPVTATPAAEMTSVPAEDFTAADQAELVRVTELIAAGKTVHAGLPNPPLGICGGAADQTLCRYEQLKAVNEWKSAYQGDYGAQRNVAFCLSTGCEGLRPDRVQGCAWRMVIVDAADPEMGEGDTMNAETECGRLSPTARTAAASHAARISAVIERQRG